jgi:DNA-binding transcriptional LysR family regulator
MRFDLTDLQLFLNVVEAGTITGGAEATFMTLASASERIRGMEATLGSPLFTRSKKGVSLTSAGDAVLHHARIVVRQMDRLQGELRELGAGVRGHVRLHCNTSALSEHVPSELGRFLKSHPTISIDMEERASTAVADALRDGNCDIGVLSATADGTGLELHPFRPDHLVAIVEKGHRLAGAERIQAEELLQEPFVGLAEGSALQTLVAHEARKLGRRIHYRVRLLSLDSVCRMVGQGAGVGVVPWAVANRNAADAGICAVRLSDSWAERSLVVGVRRRRELPSHAAKLLEHLLNAASSRSGSASSSDEPVMR